MGTYICRCLTGSPSACVAEGCKKMPAGRKKSHDALETCGSASQAKIILTVESVRPGTTGRRAGSFSGVAGVISAICQAAGRSSLAAFLAVTARCTARER